jgi:hypothetical protein
MAETKTKPTQVPIEEFLANLEDPKKLDGSRTLIRLMRKITGSPPKMWGPSIIGFGTFHYKYESGHEGDTCLSGFSPRKAEFSIYLNGRPTPADMARRDELLARLGKHRMGKACLYVKRLEDIDLEVLETLIREAIASAR